MNKRKGITRFVIAFVVPYFAFWSFVAWNSNRSIDLYLRLHREEMAKGNVQGAGVWMEAVDDANEGVVAAVMWGIFVPLLVVIVGALAYWVYRGFKPKA